MAFVPAPNIVQVELRCLLAGQHIENRFTINALTTPTDAIVDSITNVVSNWAQATYFNQLPNAVQLTETVGTDLSVVNGAQHTIVPSSTVLGGLTDPAMPNETTFCVSHRSGARGRSARGRSYVLAVPKGQVTANEVSNAWATNVTAAFNTLRTDISTEGWDWVVVSYRSGNAPRPGGPVFFSILTSIFTDLVVDSMRRRKPGVGS